MLKLFRIAVWLRAINDQRQGRILVLPEAALRREMPSAHGAHSDCGPPARDGEGGHPPATATIETVPTRCAVTTPCESTLAMLGFDPSGVERRRCGSADHSPLARSSFPWRLHWQPGN